MADTGLYRHMIIDAPRLARLFGRPRLWANRRIAAGRYGPVIHSGRSHLVDLHQVEIAEGITFGRGQLAAVGLVEDRNLGGRVAGEETRLPVALPFGHLPLNGRAREIESAPGTELA